VSPKLSGEVIKEEKKEEAPIKFFQFTYDSDWCLGIDPMDNTLKVFKNM